MIKRVSDSDYLGSLSNFRSPRDWWGTSEWLPEGSALTYPPNWNDMLPDNWRTL
jgi:hypothetical protein